MTTAQSRWGILDTKESLWGERRALPVSHHLYSVFDLASLLGRSLLWRPRTGSVGAETEGGASGGEGARGSLHPARVGLPQPPGTRRARLAPFWVIASRVGHCSWWRVGGGQGCCQPSCEARCTPAPNRIALARSVHSAAVEKPTRWSMLRSNERPCFLFMCYMLVSSPEPCAPRHLELGLVCPLRSRCP